jgi:hypothetical protein
MQVASNQAPQMLHFELLLLDIAALGPCGATCMQAVTGQAHYISELGLYLS